MATSLIHERSATCTKSELNPFQLPPTQTSIEKCDWVSYEPTTTGFEDGPINFYIPGDADSLIDMSQVYFEFDVTITKADGTHTTPIVLNGGILEGSRVAPVNGILQSAFSEVEVKLNNKTCSPTSSLHPIRAYIENLLNFDKESYNSWLEEALWKIDESNKFDDADPVAENANTGLKWRYEFLKDNKTVKLIGRLHNDLFSLDQLLLNLISLRVKLIRSSNAFVLMSSEGEGSGYKLKIENAKIHVKKVYVAENLLLSYATTLQKKNATYHFTRAEVLTESINAGQHGLTRENVFLGELPKRITLGLLDEDALSGVYGKSPFNFKTNGITHISVTVGGQHVQGSPLDFNSGDDSHEDFVNGYHTLFQSGQPLFQKRGLPFDRNQYKDGFFLTSFDISPDTDSCHLSPIRQGSVKIHLKFAQGLERNLNLIIYSEFDEVLTINSKRDVLVD
jgi:hypothetical protein